MRAANDNGPIWIGHLARRIVWELMAPKRAGHGEVPGQVSEGINRVREVNPANDARDVRQSIRRSGE